MNPRTRRAALHAIAAAAILASLNALAHSYAGLYQWALHHRMTGWQAVTWPAEIDVFLVVGELALYVAYLDGWTARHKLWPWVTALVGLAVSVAGNIGHIHAAPGTEVPLVDRLTAATSPLAAFAGLAIALLVLKQTRAQPVRRPSRHMAHQTYAAPSADRTPQDVPPIRTNHLRLRRAPRTATECVNVLAPSPTLSESASGDEPPVLRDARQIRDDFERRGADLSRRQLAIQLRARGHTVSNARIPEIAAAIGLS